jgi:D-alanine-D-alanine ligase
VDFNQCRTDLPVLLIYNEDPSWSRQDIQDAQAETRLLANALVEVGHPIQEARVQSAKLETYLESFSPDEHLVFNWCEEIPGIPHSAHQIARVLEQMGFTYTGADEQALTLSQDKRLVKRLLQESGIPTPAWQVYTTDQMIGWERFPAIVKPAFEHCGFGISREAVVQSEAELTQRVRYVIDELKQPALVEDFIDGREFHVGVIGNGILRVLPPAEIDYSQFEDIHDRLCTYEANFDKTSLAYQLTLPRLPAMLAYKQLRNLERVVTVAYQATQCRDYTRMDVRLRDGVFYVLDVNHNADISSDNSLVRAAALIGLSYGQLGSLLINLAAQRHPRFRERIGE